MNILIFNWRDIKNPSGGGAEILTHEIAKRLVQKGDNVTQFSSSFSHAKELETIDGVRFIRKGKWWTVHFHAFLFYIKNNKSYDVIIDEVHWFPFFAAVYARKKTIALTCETASKLFFTIFPKPIAFLFRLIESFYFSLYKNVPTMTISQSSYKDLVQKGIQEKMITVLPMGITIPENVKQIEKEKKPTLISVGRLNAQKGTLAVIEAFSIIHNTVPDSTLWLVGAGENEFENRVRSVILQNKLEGAIVLWGFVTETEKFRLLSKAHILVSASTQEGWGLTIPEAGMMRTPSVVYNIEGFRDIIKQSKNGVLVKETPDALARGVIEVLSDKKRYKDMQVAAYKSASAFSWDKTAMHARVFIKKNCFIHE